MRHAGRMGKQEDFVLRALEERDVRFVRLWFTDVLGFLKSVAVAPAELEGAFAEGIGFDGSAIEGFARVYEADMLAKPDPSTFQILPWRSENGPATARMFCDITNIAIGDAHVVAGVCNVQQQRWWRRRRWWSSPHASRNRHADS